MLRPRFSFVFFLLILSPWANAFGLKVDNVVVNASASQSGGWVYVSFPQSFGATPVVIVSPTSENTEPATVRIRNVTQDGFEALVVEPPGTDGFTAAMTVDYFAAEPGTYTFAAAVRMEVGLLTTTAQQGRNVTPTSWENVAFAQSFSDPAILTQIQTTNSQPDLDAAVPAVPWLEVTVDGVSSADFDIALERSETSSGALVAESIGYVVMNSGTQASLSGETFQAILSTDSVEGWNNGCFTTSFPSSFSGVPLAVVSQNSRDGSDGGWARRCSVSSSDVGVTIDEDLDDDTDRSHTAEFVAILGVSGAFFGTRNGSDIAAGQFYIEPGTSESFWTSVIFPEPFDESPYVFALNRSDESSPSDIRLRNVNASGFDIALVKPSGEVGAATETTIDYVAAVAGQYVMQNGDLFEIGQIETTQVQGSVGATGWSTLVFDTAFTSAPAMITQIQGIANEPSLDPSEASVPWLTVASQNLTASSVELALDTTETSAGSVSVSETIAYFAVEHNANGVIQSTSGDAVSYEMQLSGDSIAGWDNGCYDTSFINSYTSPRVIASQLTRDGNNGGWVRRCDLTSNSVGLTIDEDRANDSERSHTTERAGIFVFDGDFDADILLLDHFEIGHAGSAVTCEAELITVSAHSAYHVLDDDHQATIRVTATSSTMGWSSADASWALASGLNSAGASGAGFIEYTFADGEAEVQFWLSNSSAAEIDIDVVDVNDSLISDIDDGGAEDELLLFSDTGFRFYADDNGDGDADGISPIQSPHVAGSDSGQMILRAVEADSETGACIARVQGTQTVSMAYECVDPNSCVRANDLSVSGTAISENDSGNVVDYSPVSLSFDADGEAPFSILYNDAGQVRLYAVLDLSGSTTDPDTELVGSSGATTFMPADLVIVSIERPDNSSNPGSTVSGDGFVAAGSRFWVEVEARTSAGLLTPNFGREIDPEGIQLSVDSLILPSGGDQGTLLQAANFSASSTLGRYENTAVAWDNVGTITMIAEIADGDYLGAGNVVGSESSNVGRFYPQEFNLLSSEVLNGCPTSSFTYMSGVAGSYAPADLSFEIEALTALGNPATNYESTYPITDFDVVAENSDDGTDLSLRLFVDLSGAAWSQGVLVLDADDIVGFSRLDQLGQERVDGPYSDLRLALKVPTDAEDDTDFASSDLNFNPLVAGDCLLTTNCDSTQLSGSINAVFGRLWAEDVYGPESQSLPVKLYSERWNGSAFERNSVDSCTEIRVGDIIFDGDSLSDDSNRTVSVGAGSSEGSFTLYSPGDSVQLLNGDAGLIFSAPGVNNIGNFSISVDLASYPWLRFDWNQNNDHADDLTLPDILVGFGSYRGHDRVIYWQEVLSN